MGKVGVAVGVIVLALVVTIIVLSVGGKRKSPEKSESRVNPISEVRSKTEEDPIPKEDPVHEEDPVYEDDPTYGQGHVTETQLWENYRLPSSLSPLYYNVTLWPRLTAFFGFYIFTGESGVAFTCVNETDLILIHSHKLLYTWTRDGHHARLSGLGGAKAPAIKKTWLEVETQYLVVQLSGKLQAGKTYWLYTEFRGELADDFVGLYRSEYVENGVKKIVATTRLEPTYARKAFPCFDEPAMKAVFHITLIHPLGTVALANSMEIGTERAVLSRQVVYRTRFAPTVKMSPYQLDFVVSDFVAIKTRAEAEVPIRIWGPRKAITTGQGDYALNITGRILGFFQKYYNVKYPLPKLDQIALPTFSVGTLEDSFKEKSLLFDPRMSSTEDKHWALIANSYELAQTWFGNLVTMKWWNDLWLNKGLSSYATYLVANDVQPTWNLKDLMVLYEIHSAFAVDALSSSHPLSSQEEEVNTPLDIIGMFDTITYSKGVAVFRMLSDFLSEPVFAAGLSAYLKQFAYGNPEYADLWGKLQEVVDSDPAVKLPATVGEIMNRWILQMGFPVVTIDTQTGRITQNHFLLDPDEMLNKPSVYNYEWFVPVRWMKSGAVMDQYWLLEKTAVHEPMKTDTDWVLANLGVSGFYRVNYDSQNWQRLLSQLSSDHSVIPEINRAQTIDDAFNLARAKIISLTLALSTTKYLSEEREYMPWQAAINNLNYFFLMFDRTEVYEALQTYLRGKVQPLFNYFRDITANWTQIPAGHTEQYNQINAISLGCRTGVEGCTDLTKMWYRQWMENPDQNPIHPNLRSAVYCDAIAAGDVEEWEFAWKMYKNSGSASETEKLLYVLSCTKKPWLLNRYLEYTLDPTMLRKQDATSAILHVANSVHGHRLAWHFIRANWDQVISEYGGFLSFTTILLGVSKRFSSAFELMELYLLQRELLSAGHTHAGFVVHHAAELAKANVKWMAENKQEVMMWLRKETA